MLREGAVLRGRTENVGRGGVRIRVHVVPPLQLGERLWVAFPSLGQEYAEGRVTWIHRDERAVVGIRFLTSFRRLHGRPR